MENVLFFVKVGEITFFDDYFKISCSIVDAYGNDIRIARVFNENESKEYGLLKNRTYTGWSFEEKSLEELESKVLDVKSLCAFMNETYEKKSHCVANAENKIRQMMGELLFVEIENKDEED